MVEGERRKPKQLEEEEEEEREREEAENDDDDDDEDEKRGNEADDDEEFAVEGIDEGLLRYVVRRSRHGNGCHSTKSIVETICSNYVRFERKEFILEEVRAQNTKSFYSKN